MATKKKLLQAAAGSAGGGGALNVEDVFSTYLYEGNGASYSIDNGINLGQSYGSGGIDTSLKTESAVIVNGDADFGYGTGDFTIELWVWINKLYDYIEIWDQRTATQDGTTASPIIYSSDSGAIFFYHSGSNRILGGNGSLSEGAWNHVALTRNGGSTKLFANGTQVGNTYSDSTNYVAPVSDWSFGGSLAQGQYNLDGYVSNARVVKGTAVYLNNFTVPTSELTNITNTVLLTAQGSTPLVDNSSSSHTVTTNEGAKASTFGPFDAADAGEGGLVWIKNRDSSGIYSGANIVFDTERGVGKRLYTNGTDAEFQQNSTNGQKSFNANGFTLGSDDSSGNYGINWTGYDYASWTFRKAPKFFDVVTYTGNSTAGRTVSHNLGSVPAFIVIKRTDSTGDWTCYHSSLGNAQDIMLNSTSQAFPSSAWNSTTPTDSVFTLGSSTSINGSGATYVAYLFAHNDGDGEFGPDGDQDIIKCGSCAGAGVTVDLGFEPQLLITKAYDTSSNWHIQDNMRTFDKCSLPQSTATEITDSTNLPKITSTGFEVPSSFLTSSNMIYIAIRRGPMAVPTDATEVFAMQDGRSATDGTSSANAYTSGFPVDMFIQNNKNGGSHPVVDRLRGGTVYLKTDATAAEVSWDMRFDDMDGVFRDTTASAASYFMAHMWRRAPNFFDVVAYTGNGTAGRTVSHNLGVAPEMMWVKRRSNADSWAVYHKDLGATKFLSLDEADAAFTSTYFWNDTEPTDSVFSLGIEAKVNHSSGEGYIAYLFASLDGVSKVGSYTGNGTSQTIDCGFSSGARFVLIKRASGSAGAWVVYDTERGIVSGNDAALQLHNTSSEYTGADEIDPHSSGFIINNTASGFLLNESSATYIFYAIA